MAASLGYLSNCQGYWRWQLWPDVSLGFVFGLFWVFFLFSGYFLNTKLLAFIELNIKYQIWKRSLEAGSKYSTFKTQIINFRSLYNYLNLLCAFASSIIGWLWPWRQIKTLVFISVLVTLLFRSQDSYLTQYAR